MRAKNKLLIQFIRIAALIQRLHSVFKKTRIDLEPFRDSNVSKIERKAQKIKGQKAKLVYNDDRERKI